jgi:hypothetical protein
MMDVATIVDLQNRPHERQACYFGRGFRLLAFHPLLFELMMHSTDILFRRVHLGIRC